MIYNTYDSPFGKIILTCDGENLTEVFFEGQKYADQYLSDAAFGTATVLARTKDWLNQYFQGNIPESLPPVKLDGTVFQKRVWNLLLDIPYGKTVTYGDLAKLLGCRSAQAVGNAVGRNPISILIPCHRVIGAGGKLTGYAGGVDKKAALLRIEKIIK